MKNQMPQITELETEEPEGKLFVAAELTNDERCSHSFKRVSSHRVECTKCHVGLYDDPNSPVPIEALNEYYNNPKTQKFNKWL